MCPYRGELEEQRGTSFLRPSPPLTFPVGSIVWFLSVASGMIERMFVSISENLEDVTPGAVLARVLESLDFEHVSPFDLVRVLKAQRRQVAHYQAASCWSMDRLVDVYRHSDRGDNPKDLEWGVVVRPGILGDSRVWKDESYGTRDHVGETDHTAVYEGGEGWGGSSGFPAS